MAEQVRPRTYPLVGGLPTGRATRRWGKAAALGAVFSVVASYGVRRHRAVHEVPADLRAGWLYVPTVVPPLLPWTAANRALMRVGRRLMRRETQVLPDVSLQRYSIDPLEGGDPLSAYLYTPTRRSTPGGALLWVHGGNFVAGGAAQDHDLCSGIAEQLGILVVSIDYRLAPDHPYPAAHDDCYAALRWLHRNADMLHLDRGRIAVGGASAGGGLAATLAQRAHDEQLPLAFQLLVYPMLDDRTTLRTQHTGRGKLAFTPALNRYGWTSYLRDRPSAADPGRYAAAGRRRELTGLPPAWIGVGDLDLLHDEAVDYAHRLQAAGVACRLHVEPGMYHGADVGQASSVESMRRFRGLMTAALRAGLTPSQAR